MSQRDLASRLAWLVATLGGLPQTKGIIDLSKEVGASQIALTANEPPYPQQPNTLDEEAWELYKEKSLARIQCQRQKRIEEAKLQCREEQVKSLSEIWSQFLKVSTQHQPPSDTLLQIHQAGRQREEHAEAVEEVRGDSSSASYVPTTQTSSLPKSDHTPEEKKPRVTTFVDVWNHGNPSDKIIESEPGAGEYYVIRCRQGECSLLDRHFGPDPYRGARAHLRHAHSKELGADYQFSNANIIRTLGIQVKGCDTALAEENNATFVAWYNNPASRTEGADESIRTHPHSRNLRGRHRRSVPVSQPSLTPYKGRRKRLPPEDEAEQPSTPVSRRVKRGKKAEKVEARTAIPEPSRATAHDALPELADQAPTVISLEPLYAMEQETNATEEEKLHGQPDAHRQASARVRGEDALRMSVGINDQLSHSEQASPSQRDATPEPSSVTIRDAPLELADQAPADVPPTPSDATQQGTDATQEQELSGRSDAIPESVSQGETPYQETLRAYRATFHTEPCLRSLPKPQQGILTSRDQFSENLASPNTTKAAQYSTFGASAACEIPVSICRAQPQPSRAPMEPLFWYESLHPDTESSPQGVDCGIPSGETGAIQGDQFNGINAVSADLRFVASQCLNLDSRNPTQSGYYGHVQANIPHESSTSAEYQTYTETSKSQQPSLHAPVADMGEVLKGQRGSKSGETATITNISPPMNTNTPAALNRRVSVPSFAEISAFRLPGLAGLASQSGIPRNVVHANTITGGTSHRGGPTLP